MDKLKDEVIHDQVRELLSQFTDVEFESIQLDKKVLDDLGLDSFAVVELIYEVEMKYEIQVPNEDLRKVLTVSNIVELIKSKLEREK